MNVPRPMYPRLWKLVVIAGLVLILVSSVGSLKERKMHTFPEGLVRFSLAAPAPVCSQWKQHMPKVRDQDTYLLYIAARKLWRSKVEWELSHEETSRILSDVQLAADRGDWGALALLSLFYRIGLGHIPENKVLDEDADKVVEIARRAVAAGQPWGFYDLGVAHEYGYGGAIHSSEIAWAYFLKAAELGSPDAQMALADAYRGARQRDKERKMIECAFAQGHGPAALNLGTSAEIHGRLKEAITFYHEGVKFGNKECAASLRQLFVAGHWSDSSEEVKILLKELGVTKDPERASRYDKIYDALTIDPDLRFKLLNNVLPLPPEKLPEWIDIVRAIEPEPLGPPKY